MSHRWPSRLVAATALLLLPALAYRARADETPSPTKITSDKAIEALLEPIRDKHGVPGIVAGVVEGDRLQAAGAVGLRKFGSPEKMTVEDKLHIGSCTKAMTATRLAMLVDAGKLSWQSTVPDVFPQLKDELHADFRGVTLEQLLTHQAGLPANTLWQFLGEGSLVEKRERALKAMLAKPPVHPPGTKFLYSNVGYVVAGHMAEQVTGQSWEDLMQAGLFEPLGMSATGFGPPGTKDQVDQPWGHLPGSGKPQPMQLDNPAVLGPAGTVHCSLADWGRFVGLHLQGARGQGTLLKPETFRFLHSPPKDGDYTCGWGVVQRPWAGGRALTHAGSNTMWYAVVWIAPEKNFAILAVVNMGGDAAAKACDAAVSALILRRQKSD